MALNLRQRVGMKVFVGGPERWLEVGAAPDESRATILTSDGRVVDLRNDERVEVFEEVFVTLGTKWQLGQASLVFEAPRSVRIRREEHVLEDGDPWGGQCASI
jgi:hypothetical protein